MGCGCSRNGVADVVPVGLSMNEKIRQAADTESKPNGENETSEMNAKDLEEKFKDIMLKV